MLEVIMKEAATIRLSAHQTMLKKYKGNTSEQVRVTAFPGCVTRKCGVSTLLRLVFFFSSPEIGRPVY